jgi:hypothetical protein
MKWTRLRPGAYFAGPYTVTESGHHRALWTVAGPGIVADHLTDTKRAAQDAAYRAISGRTMGEGRLVSPVVVGDVVEYAGKRGTISMVTATNDGTPLFCIRLPHNRRQCLLRSEFLLAVP